MSSFKSYIAFRIGVGIVFGFWFHEYVSNPFYCLAAATGLLTFLMGATLFIRLHRGPMA